VTATLNNVPIDTAVLILSDMADLRPVALDNVLYVTTSENAEYLRARQEEQRKRASGQQGPSPATESEPNSFSKPREQ